MKTSRSSVKTPIPSRRPARLRRPMSASKPTNGTPTMAASMTVVGPGSCREVRRYTSEQAYQSVIASLNPGVSSGRPRLAASSANRRAHVDNSPTQTNTASGRCSRIPHATSRKRSNPLRRSAYPAPMKTGPCPGVCRRSRAATRRRPTVRVVVVTSPGTMTSIDREGDDLEPSADCTPGKATAMCFVRRTARRSRLRSR